MYKFGKDATSMHYNTECGKAETGFLLSGRKKENTCGNVGMYFSMW